MFRMRRAFVMIYAVGTLVLVSSLALSLMEASSNDMQVARQRTYQVLARDAAESGIEYAMAFITRQLGRDFDGSGDGGPWKDSNYMFDATTAPNYRPTVNSITQPWFYSVRASRGTAPNPTWLTIALPQFTNPGSQAEGPPVRLHEMLSDGTDGLGLAPTTANPKTQVTQFQIALTPEMTFSNVYGATSAGKPTIFYLRSRGEVLYNDGTLAAGGQVMATAYLIQTFYVAAPDGCPMPRPVRQVLDREPRTLQVGPKGPDKVAGPKRGGFSIPPYDQDLSPPNIH